MLFLFGRFFFCVPEEKWQIFYYFILFLTLEFSIEQIDVHVYVCVALAELDLFVPKWHETCTWRAYNVHLVIYEYSKRGPFSFFK